MSTDIYGDEKRPVRDLFEDSPFIFFGNRYWVRRSDIGESRQVGWGDLERTEWTDDMVEVVVLLHTSWSDYGGSGVERANWRVLTEDYADDVISVGYSTTDGQSVALVLESSIPEDLWDLVAALERSPIIDEVILTEVEDEVVEECWDLFAMDDFASHLRGALTTRLSERMDDEDAVVDAVDEMEPGTGDLWPLYMDAVDAGGHCYPELESATSAIFPDLERVADDVARDLVGEHFGIHEDQGVLL